MTDERLTPCFTLSELLRSDTALRCGIGNVPTAAALQQIRAVLAPGLERVRAALGVPVHVLSGYRSPELNRAVRGAASSQHVLGQAADIVAPGFGGPRAVARYLAGQVEQLGIDQLIYEGTWVHVSFASAAAARGEVLTAHFDGTGGVSYARGIA